MRSVLKALLVGALSTLMLAVGMGAASASATEVASVTLAPQTLSSAVATPMVAAKHRGLRCRGHAAESKPHKGKVVVPTSYCYDPQTSTHTGWHDYCTKSPDSWGSADFRGPCARHDMCLEKSRSHSKCDGPLLSELKTNCKYAYSWYNPDRYRCETVAYTYYLVIKIKTAL